MHLNATRIKQLKWLGLAVMTLLVLYWLTITLATELVRQREKTLEVLAGIESIKHWFCFMRFVIYVGFYAAWGVILRKYKPTMSEATIVATRRVLVRFFIVYEVFFGINIIAFLQR
jgi:hypothetical protein